MFRSSIRIKCFRLGLEPLLHRMMIKGDMTDVHFRLTFFNVNYSVIPDTLIDLLLNLNT